MSENMREIRENLKTLERRCLYEIKQTDDSIVRAVILGILQNAKMSVKNYEANSEILSIVQDIRTSLNNGKTPKGI